MTRKSSHKQIGQTERIGNLQEIRLAAMQDNCIQFKWIGSIVDTLLKLHWNYMILFIYRQSRLRLGKRVDEFNKWIQ